jgi:hypothetical protein
VEKLVAAIVAAVVLLAFVVVGAVVDDGESGSSASANAGAAKAARTASPGTELVAATGTTATTFDESQPHVHTADGTSVAAVDDRGFSKLANGEQHSHTFTQAVAPADRELLAHQMTLARETALQYPTVADAEAAGLHRAGPFSPGLGAHYVNFANSGGDADGVMSDDDIRKPLAWIYDGTKPTSRIAGLFYATNVKDGEGFAGPNDVWHVHRNICIKMGENGVIDAPLGADHDATDAQCKAVGGNLIERTQYLLHVWPVPGYESPEGVYAHISSAVTCDDGTYETIKDVTKVGSRTTICKDGTE